MLYHKLCGTMGKEWVGQTRCSKIKKVEKRTKMRRGTDDKNGHIECTSF